MVCHLIHLYCFGISVHNDKNINKYKFHHAQNDNSKNFDIPLSKLLTNRFLPDTTCNDVKNL